MMQKNARGYMQECCASLESSVASIENALKTVEKDSNRERIEQTLALVNSALEQANTTEGILEQH